MAERKRIQIGTMKIVPIFDMAAWGDIEERFGDLNTALDELQKKSGWQRPTAAMAAIMCNRALELAGEEPDLKEAKMLRMIPPKAALSVRTACLEAISCGMRMEHESEKDEREPVDLVLREIEKKEEPEA